jgi:hypothetical protein
MIAVFTMAVLAAFIVYLMEAHDHSLSREAYLAKEAADLDKEVAHPKSFFGFLIVGLIGSVMYWGLYEILSFIYGQHTGKD